MKTIHLALAASVLSTAAAAQDSCGTWTDVPIANPSGSIHTMLQEVSVIAPNDVWAVGSKNVDSGSGYETQTLAYHWDGASWTLVPSPSPTPYPGGGWADFKSVEALAPNDVWAAGGQRIQAPDGIVGTHILVEHWDGSQWSVMSTPVTIGGSGNFVSDIEAIAPDDIWFVGDWREFLASGVVEKRALAMHWNGSSFTIHETPFVQSHATLGHGLTAVSAVSSDDVWAVGGGHDGAFVAYPYLLHWNDTRWQTRGGPFLGWSQRWFDVHAVSADDAWVVGEYQDASGNHGVIARWDGLNWNRVADTPVGLGGKSIEVFAPDRVYVGGVGVARFESLQWSSIVPSFPNAPSPSLASLEKIGSCALWGAGGDSQGQMLPLTVRLDPFGGISNYCAVTPNSAGPGSTIGWLGAPSIAVNDLVLTAAGAPAYKAALFFYGPQQTSVPFGNGLLCVSGQIRRLPALQITSNGTVQQTFPYAGSPITAGSTWNFQFYFRDTAAGGAGFDSSNALEVHFRP